VITRIAAGMSGAGVYLVDAGDEQFVLKITPADEPMEAWRTRIEVQRSAAAAGIAPSVVHIDEAQRAVLSARIVDRSFVAHLRHPDTSDAAILALGRMLRKRRDLPIPAGMELADPVRALQAIWRTLPPEFARPTFVRDAVDALVGEPAPASTDAVVMSHNDVNPTNLVFDGARVLLIDWQTAAPNDALYDLATIALFVRLDEAACRQLVAAHNDAPVDELPEGFRYFRRCAAVLSGVAALSAARLRGHTGGEIARDATPSLGEVYQQLRSGTLDLGSLSGQWTFGLALVKEGVTAWQ
jgi:Ser/Thr protein kinase RdoA (MazF antagonist)